MKTMSRFRSGMNRSVTALALALACTTASASEIWFTIPDNLNSGNVDIFLTSGSAATGTITNATGSFSQSFSIAANSTSVVTIPDSYHLSTAGSVSNNGFLINSASSIAAYLMDTNVPSASNDITNLFPSTGLGTSYRVMAGTSNVVQSGSQMSFVATQDGTVLTITPSQSLTTGQAAGVPFTVTLNKSQAVMYYGSGTNDLTGTTVTSTAPIAAYGGHLCANVPASVTYCDHIIEQLPTTTNFGTQFALVPTKQRGTAPGDVLKIMADQNGTVVTLNKAGVVTTYNLNAGEFVLLQNSDSVNVLSTITSNLPVLVGQFMVGSTQTGIAGLGDPAFSLVPDVSQWLDAYIFNVPTGYQFDYLNIAINKDFLSTLLLDGTLINPALFSPIIGSDLVGGLVLVADGSHVITAGSPFMLLGHGYDTNYASYFGVGGSKSSGGGVEPPPPPSVPEPASLALMGIGLAGVLAARRRKKAA